MAFLQTYFAPVPFTVDSLALAAFKLSAEAQLATAGASLAPSGGEIKGKQQFLGPVL